MYSWLFEPILRKHEYVELDMPKYNNPTITITISDPNGVVKCGACVIGQRRSIGLTQYGMGIGIQDYSVKTRDAFGNFSILERAFNNRATVSVLLDNSMVDEVKNILASYRATPTVYIGSVGFDSSIVYGFYKDFTTLINYPTQAVCNIEFEGLT